MNNEKIFEFSEENKIGTVASVDTARVTISVTNPSIVSHLAIGNLVAVKGTTEAEFLIAIIDRVTRGLTETLGEPDELSEEIPVSITSGDIVRVSLIGTFRTVDGKKNNTFKRGADSFPQIDRICNIISGTNLQRFMGLLGSGLEDAEKLRLGTFVADQSAIAIASGDKLFQRHAAVVGSTGSGKSWTVALMLERAAQLKHPNIIVFDMHGEYGPLCEGDTAIAQRFKIAGPGDIGKNDANTIFLPYWALNREELLSMLLDRSDQNAPNQASRFSMHVRNLKEAALKKAGNDDVTTAKTVLGTFTVDSPIPFPLTQLLDNLKSDDTERVPSSKPNTDKGGEWYGKLTRFVSRLETKILDRRYGFMFSPPSEALNYEWLHKLAIRFFETSSKNGKHGIKVIDFSEVPSDVLPVVTGVFARLIYDIQFWMAPESRRAISMFCDEAHLYLPTRDDADSVSRQALWNFERIAKEGRKYGVGLVVISQRPSDVSKTILSQCNNFISLRLTNDADQATIKRLVPDNLTQLIDALPLLDVGEALVLGDAMLLPTRIRLDKPNIEPASATRDFWQEWNSDGPSEEIIKCAVEALRAQTRYIV